MRNKANWPDQIVRNEPNFCCVCRRETPLFDHSAPATLQPEAGGPGAIVPNKTPPTEVGGQRICYKWLLCMYL